MTLIEVMRALTLARQELVATRIDRDRVTVECAALRNRISQLEQECEANRDFIVRLARGC